MSCHPLPCRVELSVRPALKPHDNKHRTFPKKTARNNDESYPVIHEYLLTVKAGFFLRVKHNQLVYPKQGLPKTSPIAIPAPIERSGPSSHHSSSSTTSTSITASVAPTAAAPQRTHTAQPGAQRQRTKAIRYRTPHVHESGTEAGKGCCCLSLLY